MPIARTTRTTAGWSQAKQRLVGIFQDQHRSPAAPEGRKWWGQLERPALQDGDMETAALPMPVGELSPLEWEAPWYPDQKYFRYASLGMLNEFRLRIDYRAMLADDTNATREYYKRAVKESAALKMHPLPNYGSVIPWELQQVIGPAPRSPKIAEAALAGDQWLLGFSSDVNEGLQRLLVMGNEWTPTPEQSVARVDEVAALRGELEDLRAYIREQRAAAPPAKKSHHKAKGVSSSSPAVVSAT